MKQCVITVFLLASHLTLFCQTFNVDEYGAKGDGFTDNTFMLQHLIDSCHHLGGGTVILNSGIYLSGTLHLKSNITIHIRPAATLKAIPKKEAFPLLQSTIPSRMDKVPWKAFIRAENQENITITGGGTINGSGDSEAFKEGISDSPERPYGLLFIGCRNIKIENLRLENSAFWMQRYFNCNGVNLSGLEVYNHANKNNDGIDIDSSEDVIISNCKIDSSDDAIAIKSEGENPARNIIVNNCILATHASAIKLGTGSIGGFENITISNIVIRKSAAKEVIHPLRLENGMTGIDLTAVDGGSMRQIIISNIIMQGLENPIHIRLGNRQSNNIRDQSETTTGTERKISIIEDVLISNVQANDMGPYPIVITGHKGYPVRNVTLRDVKVKSAVSGTIEDMHTPINWEPHWYPFILIYNSRMPAYGIVTNYTEGLTMENIHFEPAKNEPRPTELHLNRN